eukprot:scaffold62088_cov30-Tisochrysis_lutea.AAC.1
MASTCELVVRAEWYDMAVRRLGRYPWSRACRLKGLTMCSTLCLTPRKPRGKMNEGALMGGRGGDGEKGDVGTR